MGKWKFFFRGLVGTIAKDKASYLGPQQGRDPKLRRQVLGQKMRTRSLLPFLKDLLRDSYPF